MGLFQHRPEEPTEWGGLPAEPNDPLDPARHLPSDPVTDIPLFGDIPARETISLTVEPVKPIETYLAGDAIGGADGED